MEESGYINAFSKFGYTQLVNKTGEELENNKWYYISGNTIYKNKEDISNGLKPIAVIKNDSSIY